MCCHFPLTARMQRDVITYNVEHKDDPIKAILVLGCKHDGNSVRFGGGLGAPGPVSKPPPLAAGMTRTLSSTFETLIVTKETKSILKELGVHSASLLAELRGREGPIWRIARRMKLAPAIKFVEYMGLQWDDHKYGEKDDGSQHIQDRVQPGEDAPDESVLNEWYGKLRVNSTTNQMLSDMGVHTAKGMLDMDESDIWSLAKGLKPVEAKQFVRCMGIEWDDNMWKSVPAPAHGGSITKPGAPGEENESTERLEAAWKELQDNHRSASILSKWGVRHASQLLDLDEDQQWTLASQLPQTQAKQVLQLP